MVLLLCWWILETKIVPMHIRWIFWISCFLLCWTWVTLMPGRTNKQQLKRAYQLLNIMSNNLASLFTTIVSSLYRVNKKISYNSASPFPTIGFENNQESTGIFCNWGITYIAIKTTWLWLQFLYFPCFWASSSVNLASFLHLINCTVHVFGLILGKYVE